MHINKERWKDIEGWEGIYKISDYGRLKSYKKEKDGYILSQINKTGSSLGVVLTAKGRGSKSIRIHRLVAIHFIINIDPVNRTCINHKDMNKQNNHYLNLEWVSYSENQKHKSINAPESLTGMINYNQKIRPKKIIQYSLNGELIAIFNNGKEAADGSGVCRRNILQVANGTEYKPGLKRSQAGGYKWGFE